MTPPRQALTASPQEQRFGQQSGRTFFLPEGTPRLQPWVSPTPARIRALAPGVCLSLLAPLTACTRPTFPAYPPNFREFAYVANRASNTITVLDLVYLRPDRTLAVGAAPVALAVNPVRDEVYVLNEQPASPSGSLSIIDTTRNAVVATLSVQRGPTGFSVDATGQRAFIANTASNSVSVVDLESRRTLATYPAGNAPSAAVISPDSRTLIVTNSGSGSISLFTPGIPAPSNKTTLIAKIGVGPPLTFRAIIPNCPGASSPVILPDSSKAFVACPGANHVLAISLAAAPNSWPAKQDALALTDHLVAILDVGQSPTHLTLKPDGGEIFVSNSASNSVSEIATQTNDVGSTYPIGNHPAHAVVSADNSALWVSNSGADSISLYSIADGKLISSLRTGDAPDALAFSHDEQLLLVADTASGDIAVIRVASRLGPALFTILPAGSSPTAIVTKPMPPKP